MKSITEGLTVSGLITLVLSLGVLYGHLGAKRGIQKIQKSRPYPDPLSSALAD